MSYKLADGSDSSQYKVGDLFEVVEGRNFSIGDIVSLFRDDGTRIPEFKLVINGDSVGPPDFKEWDNLVPHPKPFTKSDLKDGDLIITEYGREFTDSRFDLYVCGKCAVTCDGLKSRGSSPLDEWNDDLTSKNNDRDNIFQVIRGGTVVFQREPELIEKAIKATGEQWAKINEILEG